MTYSIKYAYSNKYAKSCMLILTSYFRVVYVHSEFYPNSNRKLDHLVLIITPPTLRRGVLEVISTPNMMIYQGQG